MLSLQVQSAFVGVLVVIGLVTAVLLRRRRERIDVLFAVFGGILCAWFLASFFRGYQQDESWRRVELGFAALLPSTLIRLFAEIMPLPTQQARIVAFTVYPASLLLALASFSPLGALTALQLVIGGYIIVIMMIAAKLMLPEPVGLARAVEYTRRRYLVIGAMVVTLLSAASDMPGFRGTATAFGHLAVMFYFFFLSQVILRDRLLDLNEFLAQMTIYGALAMLFAGITALLVSLGFSTSTRLFGATLGVVLLLTLYEPLKTRLEAKAMTMLFPERQRFLDELDRLRKQLQRGVVEPSRLALLLVESLYASRRATSVSVFLMEPVGRGFTRVCGEGSLGQDRVDADQLPALWHALQSSRSTILSPKLTPGGKVSSDLTLALRELAADLILPFSSGDQQLGFLTVGDDRSDEAFATEEIAALMGVADTAATVLWNSRLADRLRERERLAAVGAMAAGLAHEIRNPLGAIKGAAELLDMEHLSDPEDQKVLAVIVEEANRLNEVVSQFLDFARPFRVNKRTMQLNEVLEKTRLLLQSQAPDQTIQLDLDPRLPEMEADPEQLRQVILNLALNGMEASPAGALPIRISTYWRAERGLVELRVRDHGHGLSPEEAEQIFLPFFTTKRKGTGLGLAICQRIVHNHGGSIFAERQLSGGTAFVVQLPLDVQSVTGSYRRPSFEAKAI